MDCVQFYGIKVLCIKQYQGIYQQTYDESLDTQRYRLTISIVTYRFFMIVCTFLYLCCTSIALKNWAMTKVTLRRKPISGNRHTLYLDFYPSITHPDTGKQTRREFLGLYIIDRPKTPFDKDHNKETLALGEGIRAKRQIEIQNEQYGFLAKQKQKEDFVAYFKQIGETCAESSRNCWDSMLTHLEEFTGGELKFSNLTEQFCKEFRKYILTRRSKKTKGGTLAKNTAHNYWYKFKLALSEAYKERYLRTDLNASTEPIGTEESERLFLTFEEVQALAKAKCTVPVLKRAGLFSILTGLRFCDIAKLTWGNVGHSESEGYSIQYRQQKTKGAEVLPISDQAFDLFGEKREPTDAIFTGLTYSHYTNKHLKQWILKAGIRKYITFHCFRHTYATLQLQFGTDIYTVSKMLGHRDLQSTQVYAKIVDKSKREASTRIKFDLA